MIVVVVRPMIVRRVGVVRIVAVCIGGMVGPIVGMPVAGGIGMSLAMIVVTVVTVVTGVIVVTGRMFMCILGTFTPRLRVFIAVIVAISVRMFGVGVRLMRRGSIMVMGFRMRRGRCMGQVMCRVGIMGVVMARF